METERDTYHHGNLKEVLVQEAFRILESEGLEALSLRRLADLAGVSKTAPYRHFADKQALLTVLAADGFRRLADRLEEESRREPPGSSPYWEPIATISRGYIRFALENPAMFRLIFSPLGYALHSEDCQRNGARAFAVLGQAVGQAQSEGWRPLRPAGALMMSLWAELHGWGVFLTDGLVPPDTGVDANRWEDLALEFLRKD